MQKYKLILDRFNKNSDTIVFDNRDLAMDYIREHNELKQWSLEKVFDTQFVKNLTDEQLLVEYDNIRSAMSYYNAAEGNWSSETEARNKTQKNLELIRSEVVLRKLTPNPGNFLL